MTNTTESRPAARDRRWGGVAVGVVVIAIGLFFLFYNFGLRLPFMRQHNWWAFFILIGAVGPIGQAVAYYRARGRVDANVLHALTSTAAIVTVALMFLLNLRWDRWWPLFVIYGGLWTVFKRTAPPRAGKDDGAPGRLEGS